MYEEYSLSFLVALSAAGGLGACARYGTDRLIRRFTSVHYPIGLLVINLSGAFFIGFCSSFAISGTLSLSNYAILSLGFAGSYTTFSGWMVQTLELMQNDYKFLAIKNLTAHILPGWVLTLCGWWMGMLF